MKTEKKKEKKNDTNALIDLLVAGHSCKANPVMCRHKMSGLYFLSVFIFLFSTILYIGFRDDIDLIFDHTELLLQILALFFAGALSTIATFRLSLPQEKIDPVTKTMIISATAIIVALSGYCAMMAAPGDMMSLLDTHSSFIGRRIATILGLSIVPIIVMVWLVRKAAPVHTGLAGFTSFMAVTSLAVINCRFSCPIDSLAGNLIWHYVPILILSFIGYLVGRIIYRW